MHPTFGSNRPGKDKRKQFETPKIPFFFILIYRFPLTKRIPMHLHQLSSLHPVHHIHLSGTSGGLAGGTLGTLLANLAAGLALGGAGSVLGLLGLLDGSGGGLLLLALLDGGLAGGGTGLGALSAALLDQLEGGTDDGTLSLDGTASALLGDFLGGR